MIKLEFKQLEKKLEGLLMAYVEKEIDWVDLSSFSWEMIDLFSTNKNGLPKYDASCEKVFWYAIWELQHLADSEHHGDGSLERAVCNILIYLKNPQKMPSSCFGNRP